MLISRSYSWRCKSHISHGACHSHGARLALWRSRASGEDIPPITRLSAEDACKLLDVSTTASFEEILQAKNRNLAAADGDMDRVVAIESAYDILFMRSMKKRITGELEVSTSVRYADVPATPKRGRTSKATNQGSTTGATAPKLSAAKLPGGGLPVGFSAPSNPRVALAQGGVFAALGVWALVQALLESPDAQLSETSGLQMALALGYAIYSLRENKKMGLGKAAALTFGCVFVGTLIGTGIESWLRVDIVPIGNFSSPGVVLAEVVIFMVGLGCVFLV